MTEKGRSLYGGVELGGTKVICVAGTGPEEIVAERRAPTSTPEETLNWVVSALRELELESGPLGSIGVAAFGPIDLREGRASYGRLLNTPKPNWSNADVLAPLRAAFDVPIGVVSDVEAAALAEGLHGAAVNADPFVYVTVGTGIGAGVVARGDPQRGLIHPEAGHVPVPRQPDDDFAGICPYHRDCWEGMASGPAIKARWGRSAPELSEPVRRKALELEAAYLAEGFRALTLSFAPARIVVGGGVGLMPGLIPMVQERLVARLGGYPGLDEYTAPDFVAAAQLGGMAGPAGALVVAQRAHAGSMQQG